MKMITKQMKISKYIFKNTLTKKNLIVFFQEFVGSTFTANTDNHQNNEQQQQNNEQQQQ